MLSPNDLRKACEIPDDGSLGSLARQQLPLIADRIDALEAALVASRALVKRLQTDLSDCYEYAVEVESRYAPYLISRPSRANLPEGAKELGDRVRESLALPESDMVERLK